ncbi:hypothetical protein YC2023_006192 [Brassica napus]
MGRFYIVYGCEDCICRSSKDFPLLLVPVFTFRLKTGLRFLLAKKVLSDFSLGLLSSKYTSWSTRKIILVVKNEFEVLDSSFAYDCYFDIVKLHPKTESWANNSDCCTWEGIKCNVKSGEVIELDLSCSYLGGRFHSNSSLQNLHSLTTLDLSGNRFSGQIMSSIKNLSHITSLDLSLNQFSENIPSSIVDLSYLTYLDLTYNRFPGQIPSSIGNLYNLTYLDLFGNDIVGEIPSSFGNLNQLTSLNVYYNNLNGSFPIALLNMKELSSLMLNGNEFTGTIPPNITSLSKLTNFIASYNAFTGTLPSSLFTIPSMDRVDMSDSQLNGILEFGNISSLPKLRELDIGQNNLRGPIPETISKFTNLVRLGLSNYKTQGPVDFSIFSHLKWLEYLDLSYLNMTTTIDLNDFLSYYKRLERLVLSGNHVTATNKSPVLNSPLLYKLHLSGCGITEFPEFVRSQNKIKGQVPGWLWTLPNLTYLNLSNNTFTGFENSTTVSPSRLYNINVLASDNNFTGKIPSFICDLPYVNTLDLSNNNFSGLIPRCLGNLKYSLVLLNLRQNRLHGGLPENIFESLRTLDIGHNQLTGKLPRTLIHFTSRAKSFCNTYAPMLSMDRYIKLRFLISCKSWTYRTITSMEPSHQTTL